MPPSTSNGTSTSFFSRLPFLRTSTNSSNSSSSSRSSPNTNPASSSSATPPDTDSYSSALPTAATTSSWGSSSLSWNIPLSPSSASASTPASPSRTTPRTRPRKGSLRKVALSRGAAQRREARGQFVIDTHLSNTAAGTTSASDSPNTGDVHAGNGNGFAAATSSDSGPSPRSSTDSEPWPAFEDLANYRNTGLATHINPYISTDDDDDDALHIKRTITRGQGASAGQPRSPSSSSATATPTSSTWSRLPSSASARKKAGVNSSGIQHLLPQELHRQQHQRNKSKSSKSRTHPRSQSPRSAQADGIAPTKPKTNPSPLSNASVPPASAVVIPLRDDEWDYAETAWWGWIILVTTWIVFVVGIGSCFGVWSWAWDVGTTPYAPPELEDDPTLPITGYYPALIILSGVMVWVWVAIAWMGMKYFRHAKISGD
ncbi:hypothetical protein BROUX41_000840 [Berkeleyomyces rouxiae]|uniref:uncharacterized protein n=1 Tax=Berkeleyomyces rouxiae TaxID=2035830 RepID=UPI003B7FA263